MKSEDRFILRVFLELTELAFKLAMKLFFFGCRNDDLNFRRGAESLGTKPSAIEL